jgi:hypothetical protein
LHANRKACAQPEAVEAGLLARGPSSTLDGKRTVGKPIDQTQNTRSSVSKTISYRSQQAEGRQGHTLLLLLLKERQQQHLRPSEAG